MTIWLSLARTEKELFEIFFFDRDDQLLVATKFIIFNAAVNVAHL